MCNVSKLTLEQCNFSDLNRVFSATLCFVQHWPSGKDLFKVSKRNNEWTFSNNIMMTLSRFLPRIMVYVGLGSLRGLEPVQYQHNSRPAGKHLLKVSKIMLEQRPNGFYSSVTFVTLNMFLPARNRFSLTETLHLFLILFWLIRFSADRNLFKVRKITSD